MANIPTVITNPNGVAIERYTYDAAGTRLTTRTDAANRETRYQYDLQGNVTSLTNRRGQTTTYSYDQEGRYADELQNIAIQAATSSDIRQVHGKNDQIELVCTSSALINASIGG